jgi:hypothetical protein
VTPTFFYGDEWVVAVDGSDTGEGSVVDPWSIEVALINGGFPSRSVKPGDTIYLRGGTYGDGFETIFYIELIGEPGNLIVIRPYAGEHVIIDGGFWINGSYVRLINAQGTEFEIRNSDWTHGGRYSGQRYFEDGHSVTQPVAIKVSDSNGGGVGIEVINLIIHDTKQGIINQDEGEGGLMYGNIIFNVGYQRQDRGHGHGFYWQNPFSTLKEIKENTSSHNFSKGGQIYGNSADLKNVHIEGLVLINDDFVWNGTGDITNVRLVESTFRGRCTADFYAGNWWMSHDDVIIQDNTFQGTSNIHFLLDFGPYVDLTVTNNRFIHETDDMILRYKQPNSGGLYPGTWNYNEYYGNTVDGILRLWESGDTSSTVDLSFADWVNETEYDINSTYTQGLPSGVEVEVRPNAYEVGRGNIIVHNWDGRDSVPVNLSGLGLVNGDNYEIRNVVNYFGDTPITGTFYEEFPTIQLDMRETRWSYARPIGASDSQRDDWPKDEWGPHANNPFPTLGVFVIRKTN